MGAASNRFGWYLAVLQLFFNLCWTVYLIYLPKLAAAAGLGPKAVVLILLLDQGIFTICDFATGIATDKVTRVLGRLGVYVVAATALSCAAFLIMPEIAGLGAPTLLAAIVLWTVTSSALRAPPLMLLGKYARKPAIPILSALAMLGYGIAGALGPYLTTALRDIDPRIPFATASIVLMLTTLGMISAEKRLAASPPPASRAAPVRAFGTMTKPAIVFALGMIALALGYQMHFALELGAALPEVHQGAATAMADAGVLDRLQHFDVPGERHHQTARRLCGDGRRGADRRASDRRGASGAEPRISGGGAICRRRRLGRDPDERLHGGICHW